jgi:restriction endonuclease Mrr
MDPYAFEQLVVDLLVAMGYGGSRAEAAQVTQRSADEGIDGVIKEDTDSASKPSTSKPNAGKARSAVRNSRHLSAHSPAKVRAKASSSPRVNLPLRRMSMSKKSARRAKKSCSLTATAWPH